jgi:hypothetical protein
MLLLTAPRRASKAATRGETIAFKGLRPRLAVMTTKTGRWAALA